MSKVIDFNQYKNDKSFDQNKQNKNIDKEFALNFYDTYLYDDDLTDIYEKM